MTTPQDFPSAWVLRLGRRSRQVTNLFIVAAVVHLTFAVRGALRSEWTSVLFWVGLATFWLILCVITRTIRRRLILHGYLEEEVSQ